MIKVIITAEAKVKLSKTIYMQQEDYDKYLELVDSDLSNREIDKEISVLADKYNFGYLSDIEDMDDPEEVTFELFEHGEDN